MPVVKIKGIPVELGGGTYIVPPITLGALEQLQEDLSNYTAGLGKTSLKTVVDATHAALRRNYPGMTRDQVADLLDVGNMQEIMDAVMDVSGLRRKALEGQAVGESPAG
ncbi:MAG: hypothetical protein JSS57_13480 [Proteobacteria bacterium]|nr:hypothetical protein [Pseudomonadota bacterium]